jgi:hypothetical protein
MNLVGEVVLFSEGNQHHGGQIAFVVLIRNHPVWPHRVLT